MMRIMGGAWMPGRWAVGAVREPPVQKSGKNYRPYRMGAMGGAWMP